MSDQQRELAQGHFDALSGMKPHEMVLYVRARGCPTEGSLAYALWMLLSGDKGIEAEVSRRIYDDLAYIPFAGYPLKRR